VTVAAPRVPGWAWTEKVTWPCSSVTRSSSVIGTIESPVALTSTWMPSMGSSSWSRTVAVNAVDDRGCAVAVAGSIVIVVGSGTKTWRNTRPDVLPSVSLTVTDWEAGLKVKSFRPGVTV